MPDTRWLPLFLLLIGTTLVPRPSQAQLDGFNFCQIFDQIPQTEGVRSALFENWDTNSSSWSSDERWILSYQNGNPTELLFQERDQAGAWADTARAQGTYDGADRISRCTFQFREGGMYVNAFRSDFSYDANSRLSEEITQAWDTTAANPNGAWFNAGRFTYSYNANDDTTQRLTESWDRNAEAWQDAKRVQNTYDASNRLTERLEEQSDGSGGWINSKRTRKTYGSNGLAETVVETWDLAGQSWENDTRTLFSYPDSDTRVETDQNWTGSSWINAERRTLDLNGNSFPSAERIEDWTGSAWVNSSRTQNSFTTVNGTQKFEQALDQVWVSSSGTWLNETRTTLSYSGVIPVELAMFEAQTEGRQAVLRWQTASETNNAGFELQHRSSVDGSWKNRTFIESAVPGGTTSEPQIYRFRTKALSPGTHAFRLRQVDLDGTSTLTDPISITLKTQRPLRLSVPFPNPVSDRTAISFAVDEAHRHVEVTLYNLLGQRVQLLQEGVVSANEEHAIEIDTYSLSSGQYLVRFRAGDRVETRKITVVR